MKLHISINGKTFEVEGGNSIEINISGNQNFNSNTDESSYPPKRNITVVYTVTYLYHGKWINEKTNDKNDIERIIKEYRDNTGVDRMSVIGIKVQHINAADKVIYEKDLGLYKLTDYEEIISKRELEYEANVLRRSIYHNIVHNVRWNIDAHGNEFYLVRRRTHKGLEVEDFPQDVNLISQDLCKYIYCAKER